MKIDRTQLISDLLAFATSGSGLVVGQPGVGKTFALAELRAKLKAAGILHLVVPVERLGGASPAEIRNLLQRDGDFVELLRATVAGTKGPAVLIFDGFDAARGEAERAGVFQLILRAVTELAGSWNVIVSVRTFDARKSQRLLDLFRVGPKEAGGTGACRQFAIPVLSEGELKQAIAQIDGLPELHRTGTPEFRALLRIPFHLWLVEQVLRSNHPGKEFSQVTSEVELLDLYWKHRVRAGPAPEDRDFVLREITKAMVAQHTLTVRRASVYLPTVREAWLALLSAEVMVEVPETEPGVSFGHNILFDYAVSVYLLDSDPEKFAHFVAEEPARPLFLRPSLVYHFTQLWHFKRDAFWRNFWSVVQREDASLRQIIRIVLPAVVIQEARTPADLAPLTERLTAEPAPGSDAVAFTLQALRILKSPRDLLWSGFLGQISHHFDRKFAWDAGVIADALVETAETETLANCGETGRRLLDWAWRQRKDAHFGQWHERMAGLIAVPLVAKTFATNARESAALLQSVLDVVGEPDFPIDCIYRLVHEVKHFTRHDPELVGRIYERVFGYIEQSDAKTNMGGPVLALISNRRQDFDSCRYSLLQEYPRYLKVAPMPAITAGIRAVQAHVLQDHVEGSLRPGKTLQDITISFPFRGGTAEYLHDGSAIWDESGFPDQELALADNIFKWLEEAARNSRTAELDEFLALFARETKAAFLWARLLTCGAEHPPQLATRLWELAQVPGILAATDARASLGAFLERASGALTRVQRTAVENAIMRLPDSSEGERKEWLERRRKKMLGRIPEGKLVTASARKLYTAMKEAGELQPDGPVFSMTSTSRPYTEIQMFRDRGVEPESPPNAEMRALYQPLVQWEEAKKEKERIDELLPAAAAVHEALHRPDIDAAVKGAAATHLASFAAAALVRTSEADSERFKFLRKLVLEAAVSPDPEPDPASDAKWNFAAWSPAPRNEAAQALPWLTHFGEDPEALATIARLARDPVPSVRFLLFCEIWRMHEKCSASLWTLLDAVAKEEKNGVVLQGVTRSLWELINLDPVRSRQLIQTLLTPDEGDPDDDERASSHLVSMVVDYAAAQDDSWAKEALAGWRAKPVEQAVSLAVSGRRLIDYVKPQQPEPVAERARDLLLAHLDAAAQGLRTLQVNAAKLPQETVQKKWRSLYGVIDNTVMWIYFAADVDPQLRQRKEGPLDDPQREKFFRASLPLLRKVLGFGSQPETGMLLAPTAHHFMELLNGVVRYDPALVLSLAAEVVQSSKRFGYNLDSLAMKETVKLVESLLADFRGDIQSEESIKNLLELLDAFVEAGWPDALNLVWRLDEIYR